MQYEELWEGEEIVYKCKNETLVINNNPDQKTVKYKCRVSGRYNSPFGDEVCCAGKRETETKVKKSSFFSGVASVHKEADQA